MRSFVIVAAAVLATGCATGRPDHTGFHFHADLGAAGISSEAREAGESAEFSGSGGSFSLAAGGAVVPNLILGGEGWITGSSDPEYRDWDGTTGTLEDVSHNVYGFGPRITYYLMPANVYFSATPSFTKLVLSDEDGDEIDETEWGLGFRGAVGKEWFVSSRWGLGIAGVLHLSSNEAREEGPTWKTWGAGVVFSASLN